MTDTPIKQDSVDSVVSPNDTLNTSANLETVRRAKACENCRGLKTKCIPSGPGRPCVRCLKNKKICHYPMRTRKRTRRADARVAVLERKLEMLEETLSTQKSIAASLQNGATVNGGVNPLASANDPSMLGSQQQGNMSYIPPGDPSTAIYPEQQQDPYVYNVNQPGEDHIANATTASRSPQNSSSWRPTGPLPQNGPQPFMFKSVDTGVNVDHEREKLISAWNLLSEKGDLRIKSLESVRQSRVPSYESDFVSCGYLSVENAQLRLDLYRQVIYPTYPLIDTGSVSLEDMRRKTPTLFLCIMAVTSMALKTPAIQSTAPPLSTSSAASSPISPLARDNSEFCSCLNLYNIAYEVVVFQTMLVGIMSLEMLKSVILLTYWYNEPEFYHRHKSHLLANLAVSMASDLGIGGNSPMSKNVALKFEKVVSPHGSITNPNNFTAEESAEFRQLWLACYCSSMNLLNVSRSPLGHSGSIWTDYSDKCCASLLEQAQSRETPGSRIAHFAQLAHIFEDISRAFYARDKLPPDIANGETKYFLDYFERRLSAVQQSARAANITQQTSSFEPYFHCVNAYLHQFVLYVPFSEDLGRSPFTEFSLAVNVERFNADAVRCIIACHYSVTQSLDLFSRLSVEQYAFLPLFSHTRLVFCVSVLLKLLALSMCNPAMREACPLETTVLEPVYLIIYKMRQVYEQYPFSNSAICFSFVIRLLLCHFDGQVHHFIAKRNGLPSFPASQVPPSHNVYPDQQQQQQPQSVSSQQQEENLSDPSYMYQQAPLNQPMGPSQMEEEYPAWVVNDEFWRDLLPNVEAFSGYEV